MAAPVWVLSVDLQTKTATFQSGMSEAAKAARTAFTDIKGGSGEMAGHVGTNMFASRHAIMAVSEAFGVQMPRAITALMVHLGPLGAALEAAFPFAAIALGAVLIIEKLGAMHEAGEKLTQDQKNFGTAAQEAFNSLDQKLLQSGIKADELRNDHIGALKKQLELIDKQSMADLMHQFTELAKSSDAVFEELKSHWYSLGIGSDGAKHALTEFTTQYRDLLAHGKSDEASNLLSGTLSSAQKVLAAQQQIKAANAVTDKMGVSGGSQKEDQAAINVLKAAGVGYTDAEMKSQQQLVDLLNDQKTVQGQIAAITKQDKANATASTGKEMGAQAAEGARQAAEHKQKMAELDLANQREAAGVSLAIAHATIAQRLAIDTDLADRELKIQLAGNQALIDALDRGGKDYQNQLRNLHNKAEELSAEHANAVAALENRAHLEAYNKALSDLEQSEREKIEATDRGSAARLAAIEAAMRGEIALGLQETAHYKELANQQIETVRQATEEEDKLRGDMGKEAATQTQKMGELRLAAEREAWELQASALRVTTQMRIQEEMQAAQAEYQNKMDALNAERSALDQHGRDYTLKVQQLNNKEAQLTRAHENEMTQIKDQATKERNQKILAAEQQYEATIASGLTQALMGQKSFASVMQSIGNEVEAGLLQAAIKHIETNLLTKQSDAAKAARAGFNAGLELPFPANIVAGPLLGAAMYAKVMAFEGGGIVPGIGKGDTVPAMLSPGEGVLNKKMMALLDAERSPGMGYVPRLDPESFKNAQSRTVEHHHHAPIHYAPVVQAIDGTGVEKMLDEHGRTFQKHVEKTLRKMNG